MSAIDSDQFFIRIILGEYSPPPPSLSVCVCVYRLVSRYQSEIRRARIANRFQSILIPLLIIGRIQAARFIRRHKNLLLPEIMCIRREAIRRASFPLAKNNDSTNNLVSPGNVLSFLFFFLLFFFFISFSPSSSATQRPLFAGTQRSVTVAFRDTVFDRHDRRSRPMRNNAQWNSRRDVLQRELRVTVIPIKGKRNCARCRFRRCPL